MIRVLLIASLMFALSSPAKNKKRPYRKITPQALGHMKKKPCSFIHFWATWCSICIKELPELLKMLPRQKQVNPVIVDLSDKFVQDNFSKKWMKQLAPSFLVYVKPKMNTKKFMESAGFKWTNTLPYTYLFHKGKLIREWDGYMEMDALETELATLCK